MSLLKLFGLGGSAPETSTKAETKTVRAIVGELEALDPDEARFLASFAYVLGRVANADQVITAEETREMERLVAETGGLDGDMAVLVVQIAKSQARLFGGTEDYLVTREFGRLATADQKRRLMRCLFAVAAADDSIAVVEENEISRVAAELKIPQPEMADLRAEFADKFETLRRRPKGVGR